MLSGTLLEYRPGGPADAGAGPATATLGAAPMRVAVLEHGEGAWRRRRRATAGLATALAVHLVFAALFVAIWRTMATDVSAPEAIAVDLVRSMPKAAPPPPAKPPAPDPPPPKPPAPAPDPAPAPVAAAEPAPPKPDALAQALGSPLVEPPPEPKAAAAQAAVNQTGNRSTEKEAEPKAAAGSPVPPRPDQPKTPAAPAAVPGVLTAGEAETAVPAAAKPAPAPEPPAAGDPSTATARDATARLNAALATASLPMPTSFRAALSAAGSSDDANYRGSVFGALSRARQAVEQAARARHLTGQVVMAVVLTATGAIDKLSIVQSSGHPDADAFALDMVRRAAPFPPPPPGASHTFTPAISFGE